MEGATIDLDDQPPARPAQVRLLPGDPDVQLGQRAAGGVENLQRPYLGAAAGAFDRQAGVARDGGCEPT
jgi:hypothetical protein